MSFQPITPLGGLPGWNFLRRTQANQRAAFDRSPELQRRISHFKAVIASVKTPQDLTRDREALMVALGAFGLDADLNKGFFIRKVLSEGVTNPRSFANRLADKHYANFSRAFGFGDPGGPLTAKSGFANKIIEAYRTRQFEIAVGKSDPSLRLALGFRREISGIAAQSGNGNTKWYRILGSPPLRKVIEEALHLPKSFASLKLERQISTLKDRIFGLYGSSSVDVFSKAGNVEKMIRLFLVARDLSGHSTRHDPSSAALTILSDKSSSNGSDPMAAIFSALY